MHVLVDVYVLDQAPHILERIETMRTRSSLALAGDTREPHLWLQRLRLARGRAEGPELEGGGGAIYYFGGRVSAIDVEFVGNRAVEAGPDVAGGAVYGVGIGETTVVGCTFRDNRAANGGAIGALSTALHVYNSSFTQNEATGFGANFVEGGVQMGMGGNGGAISMDGQGRELRVCGSTFSRNISGALGGAIFRTGYETETNEINLSHFEANRAESRIDEFRSGGGGLYLQGVEATITNTTIVGNLAPFNAGVWILGHGPGAPGIAQLINVTIANNATDETDDFTQRGLGGGLAIGADTTGNVVNCTIVGNAAQFGAGIVNASPLNIRNTIIANVADNEWTPLNCTGREYATPPGQGENNVQWPNGMNEADDMDCTPSIVRMDPQMGELRDNGGATPTILPAALDLPPGTDCPTTDQRGEPRDAGSCTIGAVEL